MVCTIRLVLAALTLATPALADPVKDNRKADIAEYCEPGHTFANDRECWNEFKGNIAYDTGLREAVVINEACPELEVTDEDLRAFRNRKYGATQKYKMGFDRAMRTIKGDDVTQLKILCVFAKNENNGYPKAYRNEWLEEVPSLLAEATASPESEDTAAADTVRDTRKARRLAFETPAMKVALAKVAASFSNPTPGRECDHSDAMLLCEMENGETISVQAVPVKMSKAAAARECTNPYADGPEEIRVEIKGGNPKQGFTMLWCVTKAAEGAKQAARKRMAAADPKATDMPLTDTVRIYASINAIALPCNVEALNPAENSAMLEGVKSDPAAIDLLRRLHRETQAAYVKARDAGDKRGFCDRFIAHNSQYVRAR